MKLRLDDNDGQTSNWLQVLNVWVQSTERYNVSFSASDPPKDTPESEEQLIQGVLTVLSGNFRVGFSLSHISLHGNYLETT